VSSMRYRIRKQSFSIGDDYWVTDERGERAYKIDGKALRLRKALVLEDAGGHELLKIHEHVLAMRDGMHIESPDGTHVATVKRASVVPMRASWTVDMPDDDDLYVTGNVLDHEYLIERDHETVAAVSKQGFDTAEEYGVEVFRGADPAMMLAIAAVLDATAHEST
jgi:uncharacterized protein YxjI